MLHFGSLHFWFISFIISLHCWFASLQKRPGSWLPRAVKFWKPFSRFQVLLRFVCLEESDRKDMFGRIFCDSSGGVNDIFVPGSLGASAPAQSPPQKPLRFLVTKPVPSQIESEDASSNRQLGTPARSHVSPTCVYSFYFGRCKRVHVFQLSSTVLVGGHPPRPSPGCFFLISCNFSDKTGSS